MRVDLGTTENEQSAAIKISTDKLLSKLFAAHSNVPRPAPKPAEVIAVEPVLPPISNSQFALAHSLTSGLGLSLSHIERIQRVVLAFYPNVSMSDLKSARRTADVVRPRQIVMYLAKELTARSLPEIGRRCGGRDHTTVLHAVRKIGALVKTDPELAEQVEKIRAKFVELSS